MVLQTAIRPVVIPYRQVSFLRASMVVRPEDDCSDPGGNNIGGGISDLCWEGEETVRRAFS